MSGGHSRRKRSWRAAAHFLPVSTSAGNVSRAGLYMKSRMLFIRRSETSNIRSYAIRSRRPADGRIGYTRHSFVIDVRLFLPTSCRFPTQGVIRAIESRLIPSQRFSIRNSPKPPPHLRRYLSAQFLFLKARGTISLLSPSLFYFILAVTILTRL